jgi:hypothetical protein
MTTVQFTQAVYDPDKKVGRGQHKATITGAKNILDLYEGTILYIQWNVEGVILTDKFKLNHPEDTKRGYAQGKLKRLAEALGITPPQKRNPGENVNYDVSSFIGKTLYIVVNELPGKEEGKVIPYVDRYIRLPSQPGTPSQPLAQAGFSLPQTPVSTAEMLDDEITF